MIDSTIQPNITQDSLSMNLGKRNPWDNYQDDRMDIDIELTFFVILAGALCFILLGVLDAINQTNNHK